MKKLGNIFSTFVKKTLTSDNLESTLNELNLLLISNDVATETADVLCQKVSESLKDKQISRLTSKKKFLFEILREVVKEILTPEREINLIDEIRSAQQSNRRPANQDIAAYSSSWLLVIAPIAMQNIKWSVQSHSRFPGKIKAIKH